VEAVVHLAASLVVPESVAKPMEYWREQRRQHALPGGGLRGRGYRAAGVLLDRRGLWHPGQPAGGGGRALPPINPYGASKHAAERLLQDAAVAHGLRVLALRYFNVAGADPAGRAGQRSAGATHLIKVACEAALGHREEVAVFGEDYDTPTAPACATTSTSPTSPGRMSRRCATWRWAAPAGC
jgi:UDP-glucose 4-epimerase